MKIYKDKLGRWYASKKIDDNKKIIGVGKSRKEAIDNLNKELNKLTN